ncbi:MAG TPA: phospholipid carrier-dependent glycosyltransferase, partial [Candidatus Eisenbacteria bacterium]|nr:phospholipid carrier-dependent glycosyltransferase [Candidatus Eisenbacteria bacterium]
ENIRISSGMVHKNTPLPHAYEYPSLFYELSAALERPFVHTADEWRKDVIAVRLLSVAFGVLAVILVGWIALELGGAWAAYVAAAIMALDGMQIEISTMAKPNAAQVAFVCAGFLALVVFLRRPRIRGAALASACFALAAASKWLGALGLGLLALAAALALPAAPGSGWLRSLWNARVRVVALLLPLIVFFVVFLFCVPGALLSPKEFGYGFAQVFVAQGAHRRPLPFTISLVYLARSLGPLALVLAIAGIAWAVARLRRWDGSAVESGVVLALAWALGYGGLVLFAFARLPSYVDLWVPPLAVLAGCASAGQRGWLRGAGARAALLTAVILVGAWAHGADTMAKRIWFEGDTRQQAARWLETHAAATDTVLADEGLLVPDRLRHVWWNWWGEPPRVIYDETKTWGNDPVWPSWGGGHRRLTFENAKWAHPDTLLERRPRWVMTSSTWSAVRADEAALAGYDRHLAAGTAGYRERQRLSQSPSGHEGWRLVLGGPRAPAMFSGPEIRIYEREESAAEDSSGTSAP